MSAPAISSAARWPDPMAGDPKSYTVTDRTDLHVGGAVYVPGDTVTLPADIAKGLLADGIISPARNASPGGGDEKDREARIVAAIGGLDPADKALWTKGGKPTVKALEAALGFGITEAERDAAHAAAEAAREAATKGGDA